MTEDQAAGLYCAIMEELKARTDTMHEVVNGVSKPSSTQHMRHNVFVFDGLYLQLRKVCELLAVGLLTAQAIDGQFYTKKLFKEYRADRIIDQIGRLNPNSFPRSVEPGNWDAGTVELVRPMNPVFTAKELKELYFQCDFRMHSGKLQDLIGGKVREMNQAFVQDWVRRLMFGLSHHIIGLPSGARSMLVKMADPENGQVSARFATLEQ